MMKTQKITFTILLALFVLQGCLISQPQGNKKSSVKSSVKNGGTSGTTGPTFQTGEDLYWFSSEKVTGTISINKNSENVVYLRGKNVHNFLSTKDPTGEEYYRKQFCVVGNYGLPAKQLRLRAIPIFINNFTTNAIERVIRLDIPSSAENSAACSFTTIDSVLPGNAAYDLNTICPTCLGSQKITSTSLKFFESKTSSAILAPIAIGLLNLSTLALQVDLASNSTSPVGSCSNSSCEAKGFDCCIEGQCVKDASLKSTATSDPQYAQAISEYNLNPLSFINYPNIFNVCSNIAHNPPPVTNPGSTPVSEAQLRVQKYLADYKCVEQFKTDQTYTMCLPAQNETTYLDTKRRLAVSCGCTASLSEYEIKCPDWGVRPLYNSVVQTNENIVDFYCYTPAPVNPVGPITNLNVNVSSRSAPHRFYSTAGTNYDDISKLSSSIIQEGDDFYYLDNFNKSGPINESYNMNSILGRMNVGLSQTRPAQTVTVELGKTYVISAVRGFFTPCTQCAKDSWFQTFSAHPATSNGIGLRASGFTTARDSFGSNTTYGNYEDTKFGRACYLPPTMLPFSHKKETSLITQRQNRLKTQAAYYINGYQKDWYGFNKGALIGSFDGVTWFAIGTGRRITAQSTKLFLAINSAFSDLADQTDTVVNIIPDFAVNTAADFDYDPELAINDPRQNTAGSCQQYHQCQFDSDCVAQLGWEYTCADVSQMRTKWPIYDTDGKELPNQEKIGTIFEILNGQAALGPTSKRCVYRGAGAPCVRDTTSLNANFNKKVLTCAPNFYCASVTSNRFNDEIARSPNEFDGILFGMDTNVLGRPLNYVTGSKNLDNEIIDNIKHNATTETLGLTAVQTEDMGICRPGRALSANPVTAHSNPDNSRRTDYISQVGSCDANSINTTRFVTCPAFGTDLDYADPLNAATIQLQQMQNSCGGESKHTGTFVSAFKSIEALSLLNINSITQPTLAQDACFRRAGSVCHTDLDCAPNKMHEDIVGTLSLSFFGGTEAEQSYWRESLVCSQGTPIPSSTSPNFDSYKLYNNRCCREVGKDFTMYTSGPASIIPENSGSNANLDTARLTYRDPRAANRYSRYTISPTLTSSILKTEVPKITATAEPQSDQWKVINETGALTCCGGGWIRKFADGTHDWTVKNRLSLDASNFSCLNFRSPLVFPDYNGFGDAQDGIVQLSYQREYEYLCKYPSENGCMQVPFKELNGFSIYPPSRYRPHLDYIPDTNYVASPGYSSTPAADFTRLDTSPTADPIEGSTPWSQTKNVDAPYPPLPFYFQGNIDLESDTKKSYNFFVDKDFDYGVSMYLPAYIPYNATTSSVDTTQFKIYVKYFYDSPRFPDVVDITANLDASKVRCDAVTNYSSTTGQPVDEITVDVNERWCVSANTATQNRPVLNIKAYTGAAASRQWKYAGVIIDFRPLEIRKGTTIAEPGNAYYYLTKLGRLELTGIPQITYEPLYCNNDQTKLVPGIFKSTLSTRADFINPANSVAYTSINPVQIYNDENNDSNSDLTANYGNGERRFTYQDKLAVSSVFSAKDFACCTPLGKETTSGSKCCSGYARSVGGKLTCKLPRGTDLNVYFNKFVSSEGVGETEPGGGLVIEGTDDEIDFNAYTGEPKLRNSTFQKLEDLGRAYCENAVVGTGGAFGFFPPEPFSGSYSVPSTSTGDIEDSFPMSIVDSILDFDSSDPDAGKIPFDSGYRWNHHYYCK